MCSGATWIWKLASKIKQREEARYLEIENSIILRVLKHVIENTMRQNLVFVRTFCSIVDSVAVCVQLVLEPWDKNKTKNKSESTNKITERKKEDTYASSKLYGSYHPLSTPISRMFSNP